MTFMSQKMDLPYYKNDSLGLEMVSLPYEHDLNNSGISEAHMFLMLPTEESPAAYANLETTFATLDFEEVFQKMEPVYAEIEMPRMKMEFQTNLKEVFEDIGA